MADPTILTDDERQRLLAATSQPLIPSLHSIPPLPQAKEISLLGGAATPPGVAQQRYAGMKPQVSAMPGTPEYGQQRQQQLDFQKLTPWGNEAVSEHPGTWGKIGHIASRIGNIAGDILAPGITANIPGSDLNKQREAATNAKWINLGGENQLRGAQAEKAKADVPLEQEQVKNLQSEEEARLHPKPAAEKEEEWNIVPGIQGPNGEPIQQEKHSGQMRPATLGEVREKPEKPSETDKFVTDYMAAHGLPDSAVNRQKARDAMKTEERVPRTPTDREEWMADHKGQTNPNTGKPYSMEDYWTAKAGAGGAAKSLAAEEAGRAAQAYANDYLKSGRFTGAGDEALMEKYFELAKPSSGFRMTQPQIEMLTKAQDLMNSVVAKGKHLFSPEAPYFSKDLREQIVETMQNLQTSREEAKSNAGGAAQGGGGTVNVISPDGTPGTIPRANLQKALGRGYKQVP